MAPVGVIERLGELADHLHPGIDGQVVALRRQVVVEPLPLPAMLEDDGRPGLVFVAVLLGPDDAVVGDSLQGKILTAGSASGGLLLLLGAPSARTGRS